MSWFSSSQKSAFAPLAAATFLFNDYRTAPFWLLVRLYLGWQWLMAGWEKITGSGWVGAGAGQAVRGFLQGALAKASGPRPNVTSWYASFVQHVALPHAVLFSYVVTYGELLAGVALILGIFTGLAALGGVFMNFNYLLAGTVSTNPVLLFWGLLLILAWRTAGWLGLDFWVLPLVGRTKKSKEKPSTV